MANCRLCGTCRSRFLVIFLLIVILFIISTFVGIAHHEPVVEVSLETFNQLANKEDFFHHVEDMQRLRKSIIAELGQLENQRNQLRISVDSLNKKTKDSENELRGLERSLIQIRYNIESAKSAQDETNKNYSPVSLPLKLLPDNDDANHTNPKGECSLNFCFDYSRCSVLSHFPIYLYPLTVTDDNTLLSWKSAILKSHYITDNPKIACIYMVLYDGQNFEPQNLRYWKGDGRNHVIINVVSQNLLVPKSRAMHAQAMLYNTKAIRGFDIMLPYTDLKSIDYRDLPLMLPVRRDNLLVFFGKAPTRSGVHEKEFVAALSHLHAPESSVDININCLADSKCSADQWCLCNDEELIGTEKKSTFVVMLNTVRMPAEQLSHRIYAALVNGAVPVILGDHYQLPLEELIPWNEAAVLLPFQRVTELVYILRNVLEPDIMAFKKRGRFLLESYLISVPKVADGLIDSLRARINIPPIVAPIPVSNHIYNENNPMPMFETRVEPTEVLGPVEDQFPSPSYQRNFTYWHGQTAHLQKVIASRLYPHTPWDPILPTDAKFHGSPYGLRPINGGAGGSGKEFSQALGGNYPREQFTIVILTYDRIDLLQQQLAQFNGLPYLNKVLVIWNNPNYPSATLQWPHIDAPIQVIKAATNSLNNRFLPYKEIETEAVLSLDDDMYLRHDEIIFAFRVWREYRDRVVGFPGRYHAWNDHDQRWNYNSNHSCELSLVLTGAAFFHKYYMYQYSYSMSQAIRDKVDEFMNCEDLAMNFLVSHITGKPPVKTTSRWTFKCPTCGETALWMDESHFNERHECVEYFTRVYGYLPLLYTQLRMDSVLFKTRVPQDKTKCFSLV